MGTNLTIVSPNFDKIEKEAGQFTSEAISTLWQALNYAMKIERLDTRKAIDLLEPRVKTISPSASVDNLDLEGSSVVSFIGSTAQDFTGMRAPETGKCRIVFVQVSGSGTITAKHNLTSETANQLTISTGADQALTTGSGIIFAYLASKWREVART